MIAAPLVPERGDVRRGHARAPRRRRCRRRSCPAERGSSTITTGRRRSSAAATAGWPSGMQYRQNAPTTASRTATASVALAAHAGQQEQLVALRLRRLGQALEEADGARVGERVGEPLGEHQPDRAAPAGAQPARGRVRPGVAELLGGLQHLPAQLGGELVRPVVGVGDRRARDAEGVGDRLQRHPLCHRDRSTGSGASAVGQRPQRRRRRRGAARRRRRARRRRTGAPGSAERAVEHGGATGEDGR